MRVESLKESARLGGLDQWSASHWERQTKASEVPPFVNGARYVSHDPTPGAPVIPNQYMKGTLTLTITLTLILTLTGSPEPIYERRYRDGAQP